VFFKKTQIMEEHLLKVTFSPETCSPSVVRLVDVVEVTVSK